MPTGIAFCKDANAYTREMVDYLAQIVFEAVGEVVCIDLVEATHRAIVGAPDVEVNTNILNVFFHHGGKLISLEMEDSICEAFSGRYSGWQVLITPVVTPHWWANGEQV